MARAGMNRAEQPGLSQSRANERIHSPWGTGALTALELSFAELLQLCVPGQKSASLCLCHPQVKPWQCWGFYCRLTTSLGNFLQGTVLQMAEEVYTRSFQCFLCNITAATGRICLSSV